MLKRRLLKCLGIVNRVVPYRESNLIELAPDEPQKSCKKNFSFCRKKSFSKIFFAPKNFSCSKIFRKLFFLRFWYFFRLARLEKVQNWNLKTIFGWPVKSFLMLEPIKGLSSFFYRLIQVRQIRKTWINNTNYKLTSSLKMQSLKPIWFVLIILKKKLASLAGTRAHDLS